MSEFIVQVYLGFGSLRFAAVHRVLVDLPEAVDGEEMDPVNGFSALLDITGLGDIHKDEGSGMAFKRPAPPSHDLLQVVTVDDGMGGRGARDDNIREEHVAGEIIQPHCFSPDLFGKHLGTPVGSVGNIDRGKLLCCKRLGNEHPHLPRTHHEDPLSFQGAELLLGKEDCGRSDGYRSPVDLGLFPHLNPGVDRLVHAEFKDRACTPSLPCKIESGLELADDLVLTYDHGIHASGKFEKVAESIDPGKDRKVLPALFLQE